MVQMSKEKPDELIRSTQAQKNIRPFVPEDFDLNIGRERDAKPGRIIETQRDALLVTRQSTHGDFKENARISQGIKEWLRSSDGWKDLADIEREAMDMIALKFSRILSGKSLEKQHWEDVVGYAKLVEEQCK